MIASIIILCFQKERRVVVVDELLIFLPLSPICTGKQEHGCWNDTQEQEGM